MGEGVKAENMVLHKKSEELDALKIEHVGLTQKLDEVQGEMNGLQDEFRIIYKGKKKIEIENDKLKKEVVDLKSKMEKVEGENAELNKIVNVDKVECGTQTDFAFILEDVHLKALQSENAYLMGELNLLIADRSRFKDCVNDNDYHHGDISSIVVSPINYDIITGGKHDNSVRIWQPKAFRVGTSEISFIPKRKAFVDGSVLSVGMSDDGILMAAGCSLKNTVNGYVVVWKLNDDGNV